MKNILGAFALLLLAVSCHDNPEKNKISRSENHTESLQAIIDSAYKAQPASVGIMLHVEAPDLGISWTGSAGHAEKESKSKLSSDQPVLIASSIKTYVAAAILSLQEKQKLTIEDNISQHLPAKTVAMFEADGYDFDSIKIKHLLSHTSGIADYVNEDYLKKIDNNPKYRWTRDEQLRLATEVGNPLAQPQDAFSYADVNYLLCTEIIEQITQQSFYTAMRKLLKYEQLNLADTWFPTLEDKPKQTAPMAHQYWSVKEWGTEKKELKWDSYEHDISWDLYGGGGIATTVKDLAQFSFHLFNSNIIEDENVFNLLTTDVKTKDGIDKNYRLGIAEASIKGVKAYGHGGFWGTIVFYIPQLNASVAVCVLERNDKKKTIESILNGVLEHLTAQLYPTGHIVNDDYELYKAKNSKANLILFPGAGAKATDTQREFDVLTAAAAHGISVLFMNNSGGLWTDEKRAGDLAKEIENIFIDNQLDTQNTFIGGMSIGGNTALALSDYLHKTKNGLVPAGTFIVDSPIDLYALYESSVKDIANPDFDEERLAEPKWIVSYFEKEFSKDALLENIQNVSPFSVKSKHVAVSNLKNGKLRFYTEPDSLWWQENRQTDFESTNAYAIQQVASALTAKQWEMFELIETENKGYRANGDRHPHSWSIVDVKKLVEWIVE